MQFRTRPNNHRLQWCLILFLLPCLSFVTSLPIQAQEGRYPSLSVTGLVEDIGVQFAPSHGWLGREISENRRLYWIKIDIDSLSGYRNWFGITFMCQKLGGVQEWSPIGGYCGYLTADGRQPTGDLKQVRLIDFAARIDGPAAQWFKLEYKCKFRRGPVHSPDGITMPQEGRPCAENNPDDTLYGVNIWLSPR